MRASVVVAARNEGDAVARTVEACVKTGWGLDHEIVVVDDASTDGSVDRVFQQFPNVQLVRHEQALGASPAKAAGAERAQGDVLVFLDGHTKPAPGALLRLVQGVERLEGEAIVTPAVAALNVGRWQNDLSQTGHGYAFELQQFECRWLGLAELQRSASLPLYESPGLIGCAFAISKDLYERLWGFDPHMRSWGVEDLDLALKAWTADARILHDPDAVVGHHFRTRFDNYVVPVEDVLVNQLRVARKHFTQSVWEEWLAGVRARTERDTNGHPEGIWARAWHQFETGRSTAEQERAYLHAVRAHDEFWYAGRFGLPWPRLQIALAPNGHGSGSPAGHPGAPTAGHAVETPSRAALAPSPSPAPCRFTINGPANVPGLAQYQYAISVPGGKTATNIQWQSDKASATFQGATNQATATVAFAAGLADFVTLKATFLLDGVAECATIEVALVRVQVGARTFNNPGFPNSVATNVPFLVNNPAAPAVPTWVTRHVPGSAVAAFTYNGTAQAPEPGSLVRSSGAGGGDAFVGQTTVKLTAPPERPTALQRIQVGFMQAGVDAGRGQFGAAPFRQRTVTVPTTTTIDWLSIPASATDEWPWYDSTARDTGTGSGTWARGLTMRDSPGLLVPAQFNPNNAGDPAAHLPIANANATLSFQICIGARTLDAALQANTQYFDHGHSTWVTNFALPVVPGVSIVTFPAGNWAVPATPRALSVNVVPTITNHNSRFIRWIPVKNIDYTPDVTSDGFWDSNEAAIVRVESVEGDPAGDGQIRVHLIRRLNARETAPADTYSLRDMWFSPDPMQQLTVQAGDTLVLYLGPHRPIVAERVDGSVDDSPLVQRLAQIASLRLGEGGAEALRRASLGGDPIVAQYALARLIEEPGTAAPESHVTQLRETRDDEAGDPTVRLLAADVGFQREGKDIASDDAYQWLQNAIAQSTAMEWTQIAPLVNRLVSIEARRSESVPFLVKLATDEGAREPVRIAAYSAFEALAQEVAPSDAEQIVDACFQLLHSESPLIRQAGATLLHNLSARGGPGPLAGVRDRAIEALRSAQQDEGDDQVRARLEHLSETLTGAQDA